MSHVFKAVGAYQTGKEDAWALRGQGDTAMNQALADEQAHRRETRQFLGRQAAAVAQSGAAPGGTSEALARQSEVLAELDALNIRYHGQATRSQRYGEAKLTRRRANFQAGVELLKGFEKAAGGGG
jgi:hypothetical protein